ncbi:GNAT family N-acetyltransferase [Streptosporangium sp. NBC_01756]|uniref:GNAT family N-acetyltransferase n=1 Tax=Streptosporangium sp. NBC_01756 TaxID=2975950 RepID=UPI002DD83A7D|nr:GNAT family N-acetyltransferase [Streptosporangium sp. NBC_01756]WSC85967.1 GNAT family N-acetyltransferase [Streptosporangium sp. NBC_01756]
MTSSITPHSIEIRSASVEDAALLAELNDSVHSVHVLHRPDVFRGGPAHDDLVPIFEAHLAREDARVLVALSSGRPVGYALALIVDRPGDALMRPRTFVVLEHLAVVAEAARSGVGTALLDAVRAVGGAAGCSHLVTDVWDGNKEAQAFYAAAGFAPMVHRLEQPLR